MELGTRSVLNSFIADADNPESRLYLTSPPFRIYVFGRISLIFEKFNPIIYLSKYIIFNFHLFILCPEEGNISVLRFHSLLMHLILPPCQVLAFQSHYTFTIC